MKELDFRQELHASAQEHFTGIVKTYDIPDTEYSSANTGQGGTQRPFDMGMQHRDKGPAYLELKRALAASVNFSVLADHQRVTLGALQDCGAAFAGVVVQYRFRMSKELIRRFGAKGLIILKDYVVGVVAVPINIWNTLRAQGFDAGLPYEVAVTYPGITQIPPVAWTDGIPYRWDLEAFYSGGRHGTP